MYITNIYIFCVRNFCELWNGKCCCFTAAGTTPECMSRSFMCLTPSCIRADGKTCALTSVANANRKRQKHLTDQKPLQALERLFQRGKLWV